MNSLKKILTLCCLLSVLSNALFAQEEDLRLRTKIGLKYRINKKSSLTSSYRLDMKENISQFRRSNISVAYRRNLNKWLSSEMYYRFITNYEQDEHRFRLALIAKKKVVKKTFMSLRSMLQHDVEYFDKEYLERYKPAFVWRNKLKVQRKLNKRFSAKLYTEPFFLFKNNADFVYRWRNGLGIDYQKKKWTLTALYFNQIAFNNNNMWHVFNLNAEYDITRIIRPKKSKRKKAKALDK